MSLWKQNSALPYKERSSFFIFTPSQSTLKNESENCQRPKGLVDYPVPVKPLVIPVYTYQKQTAKKEKKKQQKNGSFILTLIEQHIFYCWNCSIPVKFMKSKYNFLKLTLFLIETSNSALFSWEWREKAGKREREKKHLQKKSNKSPHALEKGRNKNHIYSFV